MRTEQPTLAQRVLGALIDQRVVVATLVAFIAIAGASFAPFDLGLPISRAPVAVDAMPDIGENQQIVFTSWPGRSAEDVDDQVTYPLTVALLGLPGVKTIRSFSALGFSTVYVVFDEDTEFYWSRARVVEKLASLPAGTLPRDAAPQLGPDATGLGQVFWYTLEGRDPDGRAVGGWDLHELRTLQDTQVRYALAAADGVAEVASVGGHVQEVQVDVDPEAMRAFGVTLEQVYAAVRDANAEVGARTTELNRVEYLVRGVGFIRELDDLRQTVVAQVDNVPVRVEDVGRVSMGPALRRGALDDGGVEAVGGVVVARYGANPRAVIDNVRDAITEVQHALPSRVLSDGTRSTVTIVPFYDRTTLIDATVGTLQSALTQQLLITVLVVLLLMAHLRGALMVAAMLPVGVLATFVAMKQTNITANVVSLAGVAIAIGTMVDLGIVVTENIVRRLRESAVGADRVAVIRDATAEVAGAVLTAVATTAVSFLPVFLLQGAEGKLFRPLAYTKTFAIVGSVVLALSLVPCLAVWLLRPGPTRRRGLTGWTSRVANGLIALAVGLALANTWSPLGAGAGALRNVAFVALTLGGLLGGFWLFLRVYPRLLGWVLAHKALFLTLPMGIVVLGASVWLGFGTLFGWLPQSVHTSGVGVALHHSLPGLGKEFMPQLDEGAFLYMPSTMPHASLPEALELTAQLDMLIESVPEVASAVGKVGRADSALDPAPVSMIETVIAYHPEYAVDASGRQLRFAVDASGAFLRDDDGALVPDPRGQPHRNWRPHIRTQQDIWDEIVAVARVPGLTSAPLLQPISARVVMLQSGIRAPMAVRLRGPDLERLADAATSLEALLRAHPLVAHDAVSADRPVGKPTIEIRPDREALARYGVSMAAVQNVIEVAIGGRTIDTTVDGRERYPIRVRYPRELRDTPERMGEVLVRTSDGAQVPLRELAELRYVRGPQMIRSEDTYLVTYVMFDARAGASAVETVDAVRAAIESARADGSLTLPDGVSYSFAGSYENAQRAAERLRTIVPLVLGSIVLLLYLQFRSALTTSIVFAGVAVALAGGFLMLWFVAQPGFLDVSLLGANLRDVYQLEPVHLSVAVWVGFIALFGIATDDGVVMATLLRQRFSAPAPAPTSVSEVRSRVVEAGNQRVRACLMTTATTLLALLPILTSYGTGADVMIPMALPAVGGMSIALITLFVVPTLFSWVEERRVRRVGDPARR